MKLTDLTVSRTIPANAARLYDGLFYSAVEHEGRTWAHYGRFIEMNRPLRMQHTWMSEATRGVESVVTITWREIDGATQMTIHHADVPDDEMGRGHADGWNWTLQMLEEMCLKA